MPGDSPLSKDKNEPNKVNQTADSSGSLNQDAHIDGSGKALDQPINNQAPVTDSTEALRKESYELPQVDTANFVQAEVHAGIVDSGFANRIYDLSDEQVKAYAEQIEAALKRKQFEDLGQKLGEDNPDIDKITNLLAPLKFADRQAIEWQLTKDLGQDFRKYFADKVHGQYEAIAKVNSILDRSDNNNGDYKGSLETAFGRLQDAGDNLAHRKQPSNLALEAFLLTSPLIKAGKDAVDQFQNCEDARKRSEAEKEILDIMSHMDSADIKFANNQNIVDKIAQSPYLSDAGKAAICVLMRGKDNWTQSDTACQSLANTGLEQRRPDIFRMAIEASPALRDSFNTEAGMQKIEKAFKDAGDRQDTRDYVKWGSRSLDRDLSGYIHPWNTNRQAIERRLDSLTSEEKAFYQKGHDVAHDPRGLSKIKTPLEQEQFKYYMNIREKLLGACESPLQFKEWEGKLLGNGYKPSALETLNANKENLLDAAVSQLTNKHEKAGKTIDALINMSEEEKKRYREDASYHQELDEAISHLENTNQQNLAQVIMQKIADGQPTTLTPLQQIRLDNIKGTDGIEPLRHIEKALQDPALLAYLQTSTTPEALNLKREIKQSMQRVAENAAFTSLVGYGLTDSFTSGKLVNAVFKDGHVPIQLKLAVKPDAQLSVGEILSAPQELKDRLTKNPKDESTKRLQDTILGNNEQRAFIQSVLAKKSIDELLPVELVRAYALNLGPTSEQLKTTFERIHNPAVIADLGNDYFQKYKSLMNHDVFYRLQGERLPKSEYGEFRELLSHTEITPTQKMLNGMAEHYSNISAFDPAINALWDGSKVDAAEYNRRVEIFLAKHGTTLSDEEKLEFKNALNKFRDAQKHYRESKEEFANALTDSTMTLAAVTGSLFAPEVSIPLLASTGAGGALYNIGLKRAVIGGDFDSSAGNLKKEGFKGATTAMLGIIGPQHLGLGKEIFAIEAGSNPTLRTRAAHEFEQLLRSSYTGSVSSGGTEIAATAAGLEKPETLPQRFTSSAGHGALGAGVFHVGMKGLGVGGQGAMKLAGHFKTDVTGTVMPRRSVPIKGNTSKIEPSAETSFKPDQVSKEVPIRTNKSETLTARSSATTPEAVQAKPAAPKKPTDVLKGLFDDVEDRLIATDDGSKFGTRGYNTLGNINRIYNEQGQVVRRFDYGRDSQGNLIIMKVSNSDATTWTSLDGKNWKVESEVGKLPERYPDTMTGKLQAFPDGTTSISGTEKIKKFMPDGSSQTLLSQYPRASYKTDKYMRMTEVTTASGEKFEITYTNKDNSDNMIQSMKSSSGDTYELVRGSGPADFYYKHTKNEHPGENIRAIRFDRNGSLEELDLKGNYKVHKIDGSVADNRGFTEVADARVEKEALIMRNISDAGRDTVQTNKEYTKTWERIVHNMSDFESLAKRHDRADQIGKVYHEVNELLSAENSILPYDQRLVLAEQLLRNSAEPYAVDQGNHGTCNVSTVSIRMYAREPAQLARIVKEATTNGEVTLSDGSKMKIRHEDLLAEIESQQHREAQLLQEKKEHTSDELAKTYKSRGARSHLNQIIQTALVNSYWQKKGMRYELHAGNESGHSKERLIDMKTGEPLKDVDGAIVDHPNLGGDTLEKIYTQITGKDEKFILFNGEYEPEKFDQFRQTHQTFKNEEEFLSCLENLKPSETNPIVLFVHSDAEPFFRDSGKWDSFQTAAGGSGAWHVICITGIREKNGEYFIPLDNTWGPQGQHKATAKDHGDPVPLTRLYYSTFNAVDLVRIADMANHIDKDPVLAFDYLRQRRALAKELDELSTSTDPDSQAECEAIKSLNPLSAKDYEKALTDLSNSLLVESPNVIYPDESSYLQTAITMETSRVRAEIREAEKAEKVARIERAKAFMRDDYNSQNNKGNNTPQSKTPHQKK